MDQFINYEMTPKNYVPNNLQQNSKIPPKPKIPLDCYNFKGEPIGITWNYGDSIILEFSTTGNVTYEWGEKYGVEAGFTEDAETYLQGKKFQALLFDSRYNLVAQCETEAAPIVKILSDNFYPDSVVPGTYRLKFTLVDETSNTRYTLINADDLVIYIK